MTENILQTSKLNYTFLVSTSIFIILLCPSVMLEKMSRGVLFEIFERQFIFSHLKSKKFYVRNGANSISYFATNLERDFVLSLFYKLWSFFAWKWWWSSRDKLYKCYEIIGISVNLLNVKLWLIIQMWKSNKCIWLFPMILQLFIFF